MEAARSLSERGTRLVSDSSLPDYIREHIERRNPESNRSAGYVGLCVAQNLLTWDLLSPMLNRDRRVEPRSVAYDAAIGSLALREEIARFGSEHLWGSAVDANSIISLAGAGAIIETLFYAISDPGSGVLVPTPSYAGFWMDLETRDELTVVPVHRSAETGFRLTAALLEDAYRGAQIPISAVMVTNPDNPTGRILGAEEINEAVTWARSHDLPIVLNEIYGLSVHGDRRFSSVSEIIDDLGTDIHQIWGFSKDFSMSGLRVGVLKTSNIDVRAAVSELAMLSAVSGDTAHLLASMLADRAWIDRYLTGMRTRLTASYTATTAALDEAGIPYFPGDAGLFLLADMRHLLAENSWEAENRLWRRILDETNINLTPGAACHSDEPGFFRICFATETPETVTAAIGRIASLLSS